MDPTLSVVIPYYNGDKYIEEALQGVVRQTYDDLEVIVVDDGSEKESIEVLESACADIDLPIEVHHHESNQGISAARNTGVQAADGDFIAIHDQDDISRPERFERQVNFMEENPTIGTTMTNVVHIGPNGAKQGVRDFNQDLSTLTTEDFVRYMFEKWVQRGPALPLTTEVSRSEVFDVVGLYDPAYYGSLDQEFLFRVASEFDVKFLDEPLVKKRYHNTNATRRDIELLKDERGMTDHVARLFPDLFETQTEKRDAFLYLVEVRKWYEQNDYQMAFKQYLEALKTDFWFTFKRTIRFPYKMFGVNR